MLAVIKIIDGVTAGIGKVISILTLLIVLLTTSLVVLRYGFNWNSIAWQEVVLYMHATVFLLGAAWALQTDSHVRVDILYRGFSARKKAIANIIGTLFFLFPFFLLILYFSWGYMLKSWAVHESSTQAGGLPYVYLLKTLMPIFAVLMLVQGVAELCRNILILSGKIVPQEEQ